MNGNSPIAEARVALTVTADTVDMDLITEKLKLNPTRQIHKGEVVGHIPAPLLAGQDQWVYAKELSESYETDTGFNELLIHLNSVRDELNALTRQYSVTLQLYVKSDHAHMYYRLMPETLGHLMSIGIPLEVSSFSWGGL